MANPKHVALLKAGVICWNNWRRENPDETPDLSGADLNRIDLRLIGPGGVIGVNLKDANLRGAKLMWANLVGADLRDADLSGAYFQGANLLMADIGGAKWRRAHYHKGLDMPDQGVYGLPFPDSADWPVVSIDTRTAFHG